MQQWDSLSRKLSSLRIVKKFPKLQNILKAYMYGILVALETQQNHPQACSYLRIVLIVYTL